MPFIRTNVHRDTPQAVRQLIVIGIHKALVTSIGMPEDELFNMVNDYEPSQFWCSRTFNGVARSERGVVIEITLRRGRSNAMKHERYTAISNNLSHDAGVAPIDIFIFMHENDCSDWSVGNGKFAMASVQQVGAPA